MKWKPLYQCPKGCKKYFGSSVALKWHNEVKHGEPKSQPNTEPLRQ